MHKEWKHLFLAVLWGLCWFLNRHDLANATTPWISGVLCALPVLFYLLLFLRSCLPGYDPEKHKDPVWARWVYLSGCLLCAAFLVCALILCREASVLFRLLIALLTALIAGTGVYRFIQLSQKKKESSPA